MNPFDPTNDARQARIDADARGANEDAAIEAYAAPLPFTPADAGCIFDGVHGQTYNDTRVVRLARNYGMPWASDDAADNLTWQFVEAGELDTYDPRDCGETVHGVLLEMVREAVDYLNTLAPAGHTFRWFDGDFRLDADDADA